MPTTEEFWRTYDAVESRLTAPVSERMLDLADVRPGMRVLDLASGRGEPALGAAYRVGPTGQVHGVELDAAMVQMARAKAEVAQLSNVHFRLGDAASVLDLPRGDFDAATIRWGLMYMRDPVATLAGVRTALRPNAPLVAALWAEPDRVPYFTLPRRLLARYRPVPKPELGLLGTFRYSDPDAIARDFAAAGFHCEHVEELDVPVFEASTATEVVAWVRALGLSPLLAELPEREQQAWESELTVELERHRTDGMMRLGGVTRIVRARGA